MTKVDINWYEILPEFPMYAISRLGKVIRLPNTKKSRSGKVKKEAVRFLSYKRGKYLEIVLRPSYIGHTRQIHRLLAQCYIPNPEGKSQVNHKDGNKYNYNIDNLEWMTPLENVRHAIEMGLGRYDKGKSV